MPKLLGAMSSFRRLLRHMSRNEKTACWKADSHKSAAITCGAPGAQTTADSTDTKHDPVPLVRVFASHGPSATRSFFMVLSFQLSWGACFGPTVSRQAPPVEIYKRVLLGQIGRHWHMLMRSWTMDLHIYLHGPSIILNRCPRSYGRRV